MVIYVSMVILSSSLRYELLRAVSNMKAIRVIWIVMIILPLPLKALSSHTLSLILIHSLSPADRPCTG